MANPKEVPSLPQAPDRVLVDPLRLTYKGEPLFQPVNHAHSGSRWLYDRISDPLTKRIMADIETEQRDALMKCIPNLKVLLSLGADLAGQCELTPREPQDVLYAPKIDIRDFPLHDLPPGSQIGAAQISLMTALGAKAYAVHFDEPISSAGLDFKTDGVPPLATKVAMEAARTPGVGGFGLVFPYVCVFWMMPLFVDREEFVIRELRTNILRTMHQHHEARMRELHQSTLQKA